MLLLPVADARIAWNCQKDQQKIVKVFEVAAKLKSLQAAKHTALLLKLENGEHALLELFGTPSQNFLRPDSLVHCAKVDEDPLTERGRFWNDAALAPKSGLNGQIEREAHFQFTLNYQL